MKRIILGFLALAWTAMALGAPVINTFTSASLIRPVPTWTDNIALNGTTNVTYTIPAGARILIFGGNCTHFWAKNGGTAVVPSTTVTDGSGSTADPAGFWVPGITSIGFISSAACELSIDVYK